MFLRRGLDTNWHIAPGGQITRQTPALADAR
jgi:hypothetical protein